MKKILALILAGVMLVSISVMAFAETTEKTGEQIYQEVFAGSNDITLDKIYERLGALEPSDYDKLDDYLTEKWPDEDWADKLNADFNDFLYYPPTLPPEGTPGDSPCTPPSSDSGSSADDEVYDRGSEAEALAIEATGIPMETTLAAVDENKSVGEYMNNAVTAAPGLDQAVPVSQGGNVIINGQPSNQTFSVLKVLSGHTDSAKAQAASIGGRVLNVARIDASVYFDTATVNFYMPGVKSGQNIQVYQYDYTSGQWTGVSVAEIREDHVVVDMTSLGVLAFIEVPTSE